MIARLMVQRAGPLTSLQDEGRFGMLRHGISASGPMDRSAYFHAGALAGGGHGGVEFTTAGLELQMAEGACRVGFAGADFVALLNGVPLSWPGMADLTMGDRLSITPGRSGNYGYLRFDADIEADPVMGSIATSSRSRLGGPAGRALRAGDEIVLGLRAGRNVARVSQPALLTGPIRVTWGIHADLFSTEVREKFVSAEFTISPRLDRMGVWLKDAGGVLAGASGLSLVSDAIVAGDIQILGDGTPIVLMRDHQPTGGYPRIATVTTADLDRFAQLRPGSSVAFRPVTVEHAHALLRGQGT